MNGWLLLPLSILIGSIPFGLIVARLKGVDILKEGSGNIGATNVGRVIGKGPAIAVLLLDALKGFVPAFFFPMLMSGTWNGVPADQMAAIFGVAAAGGHIFSPFLKFKGGKGISTGLGLLLGSSPIVAAIALGTFILAVAISRIVSLASVAAVVAMVVSAAVLDLPTPFIWAYAVLALLVIFAHRGNIQKLVKGEEKKFSFKKSGGE